MAKKITIDLISVTSLKKKTATVPSTAEQEKGLRGSQLYYKQILW